MTARFVYCLDVSLDPFHRTHGRRAGRQRPAAHRRAVPPRVQRAGRAAVDAGGGPRDLLYEGLLLARRPRRRVRSRLPARVRRDLDRQAQGARLAHPPHGVAHNTSRLGGADAVDRLAELRRTSDGDIGVGGATVATAHCARAPARRAAALHAPGCARRGSTPLRRARRAATARSAPAEIVRERRDDAPLRGARGRQLAVMSAAGHQRCRCSTVLTFLTVRRRLRRRAAPGAP